MLLEMNRLSYVKLVPMTPSVMILLLITSMLLRSEPATNHSMSRA